MRVVILFEPDESCVDPNDQAEMPRKHYEMIQPSQDAIVMWREYLEGLNEDGYRTHVVGSGVFENATVENAEAALGELLAL